MPSGTLVSTQDVPTITTAHEALIVWVMPPALYRLMEYPSTVRPVESVVAGHVIVTVDLFAATVGVCPASTVAARAVPLLCEVVPALQ